MSPHIDFNLLSFRLLSSGHVGKTSVFESHLFMWMNWKPVSRLRIIKYIYIYTVYRIIKFISQNCDFISHNPKMHIFYKENKVKLGCFHTWDLYKITQTYSSGPKSKNKKPRRAHVCFVVDQYDSVKINLS